MGLDWFTLIAQVVNFLVLVWLLKRFLFGRIVRAMNEREAKIVNRLEEAAHKEQLAEQEAEAFRARQRELEAQRAEWLAQAREEVEAQRQEMMEAVRKEVEAAQARWLEGLEAERQEMLQGMRERLSQQVFALARHGLKELADADLEERIVDVFVERLRSLDAAEREAIVAAIRENDRQVEVRTAFPLKPEAREKLDRSLIEHLDDELDVRYTVVPDLICGIELWAHSHRLVWSLDSYMERLEARVFEILDEGVEKHAKAG